VVQFPPGTGWQFASFVKEQRDLIPEGRLTWDRGGCWTLAQAVRLWLGPQVELWMLADARNAPHHVIAKIGDSFLDVRGAQTETRLLDVWAKQHPQEPLTLIPFDPARAQANDLYLDADAARKLVRRLQRAIGTRQNFISEPSAPDL
jgi:hypothetical protein